MFGNTVEVMNLYKENIRLGNKVEKLEAELRGETEVRKKLHELAIEDAKNIIRKEMQKKLIESDLLRTEAVAKLETYQEMDTKDDRKHMRSMLDKAITSLGQRPQVIK